MFGLGIFLLPEQWQSGIVIKHPDAKTLNDVIAIKKADVERILHRDSLLGSYSGKDAREIAKSINVYLNPERENNSKKERKKEDSSLFLPFFREFMDGKKNPGTKGLYRDTYYKVTAFCRAVNKDAYELRYEDITKSWLASFEEFCMRTEKQNTASRHLRDIRAVLNAAIDEGFTTSYPFRRFKIKRAETIDKSYSAEELRCLFDYDCYPGGEKEAVDIFKLMFCLIGINSKDLANAETIKRGRLDYIRAKTKKRYSIKIEQEALDIINRYKGKTHILDILERCPNYKTYFNRMGKTLRKVGKIRRNGMTSVGEAILPDVCIGSARTSWATIAQSELDIPRDVIAAALGHHTVDVTSTYLRTDWRNKVDEANRKVMDWVFYKKK